MTDEGPRVESWLRQDACVSDYAAVRSLGDASDDMAASQRPRGPMLIHLNGPSRIGKSTLARRYGDDHPGVLVLDIDVIAGLIGGSRDDFFAVERVARELGRCMARHHLGQGRDVIVPQLFTAHDKDPRFDQLAHETAATYVEIALLADRRTHRHRVRDKQPVNEIEATIQRLVEDPQSDLLERIDEHLAQYLDERPDAVRLDTSHLSIDETYRAVLSVVEGRRS